MTIQKVPEQVLIALVRNDVIGDGGWGDPSLCVTLAAPAFIRAHVLHAAEGVLSEMLMAGAIPARRVAALLGGTTISIARPLFGGAVLLTASTLRQRWTAGRRTRT